MANITLKPNKSNLVRRGRGAMRQERRPQTRLINPADMVIKWKRVATPEGTEHQAFVGVRHLATVFKDGADCWTIRDVAKDTEDDGYPTLADAKDAAECLADE